jgi:TRAP-type C4-dicarboxylate transport system substrate-binding protein
MMLKKFRCLALVMALILVIVSNTTFAAKKPIKIIYGHVFPDGSYYIKGDIYFKKLVEKNSKGQILVDFFPASQLGGNQEMLQATKNGSQQMILAGLAPLAQWLPKMATLDLPYLVRDRTHQLKLVSRLASIIDQDELAAKTGMRILGVRLLLPWHLFTKFPVNKLEDIKGLKIRVPETQLQLGFWRTLGAIPVSLPLTDAYTALATGTVEAVTNSIDNVHIMKFYEITKYCIPLAYIQGFTLKLINNKFWKTLTAKQKKILQDAEKRTQLFMIKVFQENEKEYEDLLVTGGMKFMKLDLASFIEKAKTIWGQYGDKELIEKIQAVK